ncbi:MAG: SEC-C domain-containing protein [Candidatus Rokuibacteriota bacterium]
MDNPAYYTVIGGRRLRPRRRNRIGRNDACPCGSGRKFTRCHGSEGVAFRVSPAPSIGRDLQHRIREFEARELQRQQQQGLGRPIVSALFQGHRLVAVRGRLRFSKEWKTFHDFLMHYIKIVRLLDATWARAMRSHAGRSARCARGWRGANGSHVIPRPGR